MGNVVIVILTLHASENIRASGSAKSVTLKVNVPMWYRLFEQPIWDPFLSAEQGRRSSPKHHQSPEPEAAQVLLKPQTPKWGNCYTLTAPTKTLNSIKLKQPGNKTLNPNRPQSPYTPHKGTVNGAVKGTHLKKPLEETKTIYIYGSFRKWGTLIWYPK